MTDESLPKLTKAAIPVQTQTLRMEERLAQGKALRKVAVRKAQMEWMPTAIRPDPVELLIDVLEGMIIGVVASLIFVVFKTSGPHVASLGRVPSVTGVYSER